MKKIIVIVLCVVACWAGNCCKAESPLPVHIDLSMELNTAHKGITPKCGSVGLSYDYKRFSLLAVCHTDFFVPKDGMTHNYNRANNLGGGLGYYFLPSKTLEARGLVTRTLGHADYRNTAYNLGVYWHCGSPSYWPSPVIGLGYSCKDFSCRSAYHGVYVSFGFRF